jgi:6-phosphogluconolactonase
MRANLAFIATLLTACGGGSGSHTVYTLGGTISGLVGSGLVLNDSNGGNFSASANGVFRFPSALASGSTYSVTVSAQPSSDPPQFCTVTNAEGTINSANISNVSVTCHGPFVYAPSGADAGISAYTMDVTTGALTPIAGSPFACPDPNDVVVDAAGKFAYVANFDSNDISVFAINAATGALTSIAGSPFPAGTGPQGVTIHPSGNFAYVVNSGSNNVSAYTINSTSGALTPVAGSPFPAGMGAVSVIIDPSGKFAYVINSYSNNISAYAIDITTGTLTSVAGSPFASGPGLSPFNSAPGPGYSVIAASGKFLYVVAADGIYAFTVNAATGALTVVAGSPFSVIPAAGPITLDPTDNFVYVTSTSQGIVAYAIDAITGALLPLPESPFATDGTPEVLTFSPGGQFAYLAGTGNIAVYSFDPKTGALTLVGSQMIPGGNITTITIDPSGKFIYTLLQGASRELPQIYADSINTTTGALTPVVGTPYSDDYSGGTITIAIPH